MSFESRLREPWSTITTPTRSALSPSPSTLPPCDTGGGVAVGEEAAGRGAAPRLCVPDLALLGPVAKLWRRWMLLLLEGTQAEGSCVQLRV